MVSRSGVIRVNMLIKVKASIGLRARVKSAILVLGLGFICIKNRSNRL